MHCPFCQSPDSRVVDTRIADDGASIRRRRECTACKHRFTTLETSSFQVVKRSGVVEPFSRNKVVQGVMKACQGRPVNEHDLARLAQQVEEKLRTSGVINVSSDEVGKAILPFLAQLDEIAYLRFASVYLSFNDLDDFEAAITELRQNAKPDANAKPEANAQTNNSGDSARSAAETTAAPQRAAGAESSGKRKTASPASASAKKSQARSHTSPSQDHQSGDEAPTKASCKRRSPRKKATQDAMPSLLDS